MATAASGGGTAKGGGAASGSVWLRPPRQARAEPPLSRDRIVTAAVALLDDEGMDRLTMRRLAERLGAGATTLYWHVETKDDVVDLAFDAIFGEAPLTGSPREGATDQGWRDDVVALLTGCRTMLLNHPWSGALPLRRRPSMGPNFLGWLECLQSTLVRAGFRGQSVQAACWVLYNHVQCSTASQSSLHWPEEDRLAARERLRAEADRYPTLVAGDYVLDDGWEENFRLGLRYVLDGLEARLAADAS
ncbi:TetR/AcrR family transcriptional regulator C-terminal domain-containing protein [Streptomyces sp. NPDC020875]|uniref:TetR/AcrR family transcriptional regulator C-terminal domain-containing protein n=1 Tax=Streptomyces sp. NPDC020875 TaxID=3154898 RepID=UPI0033F21C20